MISDNSDLSWERWGKENPYYGVLTDDRFRSTNLNDGLKFKFFETGRMHVDRVLKMLTDRFGSNLQNRTALDFGCGVGRIVVPLARVFEHVTAVDVSDSMLDVTAKNCSERDLRNVNFVQSDDDLSKVTGKFDLIHSYLVFQHIPVARGEKIIVRLLEHLNDDGVLAVHLPFLRKDSKVKRFVQSLRKNFRPASVLVNVIRRRPWNEPFIQMNMYDLNRVSALLSEGGVKDVFMEVVDAGGFVSAFVITKKSTKPAGKTEELHLWAANLDTV